MNTQPQHDSGRHPMISEPSLRLIVDKEDLHWSKWDKDSLHTEHVNVVTHGLGFGASVGGAVLLCMTAALNSTLPMFLGCLVYSFGLVGVYLASTLSHCLFSPKWRTRFRIIDQVSIFVFMAGSFTPFAVGFLMVENWWLVLPITWGIAAVGMTMKIFVTKQQMVPVWYYAMTGWFPAISLLRIGGMISTAGLVWILAGGVSYSVGLYYFMNDHKTNYHHGLWHLCVVSGTVCHYVAILCFVVPAV
ncbi:MAG: hemolysin III family protein [Planctomycetaceae bacterium]|jgi:hemolysin III|nr:hemolysin III family protein [bacterium]MDG2390575.1 hemolysin III family protein [Planctomycetaceae bacterium]